MYTFTPDTTTYSEIIATTTTEIGTSTALNPAMLASIVITCGNTYSPVHSTNDLAKCPDEQPIRETVTYTHELILGAFFSEPLMLKQSAEMMKP